MIWRLIREDEDGFADFPWNKETQHNFRLTKHITQLEAGEIIRVSTKRGLTEWYLLVDHATPPAYAKETNCPMCGGSGRIKEAM